MIKRNARRVMARNNQMSSLAKIKQLEESDNMVRLTLGF